MASKNEISEWFDRGLNSEDKPTHMLIVCDTYDYEDYPVYVLPTQDVNQVHQEYTGKSMQKVMEVYNLGEDKDAQLNTRRTFKM